MDGADLSFYEHGAARHDRAALSVLDALHTVLATIQRDRAGVRLHGVAGLAPLLAPESPIGRVAAEQLGPEAKPGRAILFDKTPATNWSLGWHHALAAAGVATSPEVGRAVIREELAAGGTALPWGDERLFAEKMVGREVSAHAAALARGETVVLDRGVPDVVGFLRVSGCPVPVAIDAAARAHRYHSRVFLAPFWADIYTHDPERRQSAERARATEAVMRDTYAGYGYRLLDLPRASVTERGAFVLRELADAVLSTIPS